MRLKKILRVIVFFAGSAFCQAPDTIYSLSTEIGLGYSRNLTTMDYKELNKNGFSGTLRVMWNPEHLLSIGLETGYQYLYSIDTKNIDTEFGTTDFSASMVSVPVFIALAMKITPNIKLTGGSGTYFLFNQGNIFGDELNSSQISIGAYGGISYTYPLTNTISVGGELMYSYISKIQDQTLALQFLFVYDLLKW
jgi:hypothetical protein